MLQELCYEHEFTVFAVEFDNPCPERIRFVRVPVPTRPLALLFLAYHLVAPMVYWLHRLRTGDRFDLVQMVESNLSFGQVSYAQFCHRAYLERHWKQAGAKGLRGWLRWLDHWLHALLEPWVYRRVRHIVVASQGLKRELEETYPFIRGKVTVIPNPVDLDRMRPPEDFDREGFRRERGAGPGEVILVFVALGHFERKGLPLVLEALRELGDLPVRLWVVGGEADLVGEWRKRVERMSLAGRVTFFGMQRDVRPFLWGADAFVFPSLYEVFPLVSLEAAAAGLPLIVTPLYGVEEFMQDGETGFVVERSVGGVAQGLRRLISLPPEERRRMGERAQKAVAPYGVEPFGEAWKRFYGDLG
ncbi:glycosyltransferase family 4 protein [Thermus sediminis]|uniref:glycosyltransferase family 4 protein n=1 Tax=Thermus sediminis TaxID=1761908 RepID=UPI0018E57EDB|nr:glycosyltransferase family 4 protein [Thermus sediminis]